MSRWFFAFTLIVFALGFTANAQAAKLVISEPCVLSGPMMRVVSVYRQLHPDVAITTITYKPGETVKGTGAVVLLTTGAADMTWYVKQGLVSPSQVRNFSQNTYPLAVITAAQGPQKINSLQDLANRRVKKIWMDDPAKSGLGQATKDALIKLGIWPRVKAKAVHPTADSMVLEQVISHKVDAAIVFKDCLLEGGRPPKTIRIVGEIPITQFATIPYQIAPLKGHDTPETAAFISFLTSPEGAKALREAKLNPQ